MNDQKSDAKNRRQRRAEESMRRRSLTKFQQGLEKLLAKVADRQAAISGSLPEGSSYANTLHEALEVSTKIGFPVVLCPSFSLDKPQEFMVLNETELEEKFKLASEVSPTKEVLIRRPN